jgi:hypothetical protein
MNRNSPAFSIGVWRFRWPLVIYEKVGVQWSLNGLEPASPMSQVEKIMKIAVRPFIRKSERTLLDVENAFELMSRKARCQATSP